MSWVDGVVGAGAGLSDSQSSKKPFWGVLEAAEAVLALELTSCPLWGKDAFSGLLEAFRAIFERSFADLGECSEGFGGF